MEDWVWVMLFLALFSVITLANANKELVEKLPKKEKEKYLKDQKIKQDKNSKILYWILGIFIGLGFLWFYILFLWG